MTSPSFSAVAFSDETGGMPDFSAKDCRLSGPFAAADADVDGRRLTVPNNPLRGIAVVVGVIAEAEEGPADIGGDAKSSRSATLISSG